jgi:hypothetical protein
VKREPTFHTKQRSDGKRPTEPLVGDPLISTMSPRLKNGKSTSQKSIVPRAACSASRTCSKRRTVPGALSFI